MRRFVPGGWRVGFLLAVAVVTVAAVPGRAAACDCAPDFWYVSLPKDGAAGVPTNTRVFLGPPCGSSWNQSAIEWMADDGTPVFFDIAELTVLTVLVPRQPLRPNTRYRVGTTCSESLVFTTGSGPDTVAPDVPGIVHVGDGGYSSGYGDSCGSSSYIDVEVRSDADLVLLDLGSPTDFSPATMTGEVNDVQPGGDPVKFYVGNNGCSGTWAGEPGDTVTIRFAALDGAGNLSAWSEPREVTLPDGCGCRSAGTGGAGFLALGMVGLALRRRR